MSEIDPSEWLSLHDASEMIGVHPSTLRRWADAGRIPCIRTAGGHRRFQRSDLDDYLANKVRAATPTTASRGDITAADSLEAHGESIEAMIHRQWHAPFVEAHVVERMRPLGQRLLGLLIQYLTRSEEDERFLKEGREVGYDYGYESYVAHIELLDAVEAFLYFRVNFSQTVSEMPSTARLSDGPESVRLYQRIDRFMNAVLLGLIAAYEEARDRSNQGKDT